MFLGIDHLVIAVADPDDAAMTLERELGLAATGGGRHDALGTFNRVVWLGDTYLELSGVFDRSRAAESWLGEPTMRGLEAGGGLVTWAIATDALRSDLAGLQAAGSDLGEPLLGERARPDNTIVRWWVALPPHLGPSGSPFLIEHDASAAEWTPTDHMARSAQRHPLGGPARLEAIELAMEDLRIAMQRFGRTVGLRFRPSITGEGARDSSVGNQTLRLRSRRGGSGEAVIHLAAPGFDTLARQLLGCRWVLRPTS